MFQEGHQGHCLYRVIHLGTYMDFEELLELNYIRKEITNKESTNQKDSALAKCQSKLKTVYCIPLLIKHINLLDSDSFGKNVYTVLTNCGPVRFQRCLIYGRVMSKNTSDEKRTKFLLDDSSDTIQVVAFNDLCNINELRNEVLAIEEGPLGQRKSDIVQSMKNIIRKMEEQLNYAHIPLGSKILVCGQPNLWRDKIIINAKFVFPITSYLEIEIAFKEYLIDKYETMF